MNKTFSLPIFVISLLLISTAGALEDPRLPATKMVPTNYDLISDDGSEIRNLVGGTAGESVHCRLPAHGVTQASRHKTVEQIWYVLNGVGELWRKDRRGEETVVPLSSGTSLTVPLETAFQFRNLGKSPLDIFIVNLPHWSGVGELVPVKNHWPIPASP
jgi:mannose-6-phosphate isomerase-like protein (cupin superfamily)